MAQIVKLRRSSVSGQKPTNSNLQLGELALNTTDGKVFMAVSGSGGPSVQELVSTNTVNTGSIYLTDNVTASFFTGSFKGDGSQLYNIPISGVTNLTTISSSLDSRLDVLEAYSGSQLVPSSSMSFRTLQTDVYCQNNSGYQINKGNVVRIVGAVGDNPQIATASLLTEGQSANTLGIATENIPNGGNGLVITEGVLVGVNTTGMTAGDLLYLGTNGSFTTTKPVAPNHGVRLGEVLRVQQNNGSIYVRIDNGMELDEAHDVIYTGITTGDLLIRSGSVWKNSKELNGNYNITGSLIISQNLTVLGSSSITYVTSSQLQVATSFISVNVFEPAERFGGLKVYDSGSSNATASLAWDSEHNHWIYQNISGSQIHGGMFLAGPINSGSLGEEPGLITGRIVKSVGDNHIDVSIISETGTTITVDGHLNAYSLTGSIDYGNLTNVPTLVSGSEQIVADFTFTTDTITNTDVNIVATSGDIILDADGDVYLGSATAGNGIVTDGYLDLIIGDTSRINTGTGHSITDNLDGISNTFNSFTSSYTTGSFTGSFIGDGSGLYNLPNVSGGTAKLAYFNTDHSVTSSYFAHITNTGNTLGLGTDGYTIAQPERLVVDNGKSYNIATFQTSKQESYAEVNIKNFGSGSASSADLVLWNDQTTENSNYVNLGINSSNYTADNVGYNNDGYLFSSDNDLYVGSLSSGSHGHLHLFGGNLWKSSSISIYNDGTIGINTDKDNNNATTIPSSTNGFAVEISGSVKFRNDIVVQGTITAEEIHTSYVTSSVLYQSGSNKFGDTDDDVHQFTGSLQITGSLYLNGQPIGSGKLNSTEFYTYTSSINPRLQSLETESGSIRNEFNVHTSSVNFDLYSLHVESGSMRSTFNTFTSSYRTGSFTGSFVGDGSGLENVPLFISGTDINGNQYSKNFYKLQFDSDTGLNVSESIQGTAFISIGSHFKDIFVDGQPILSATGSDSFEIIPEGGVEIFTSITDTNYNSYTKELKFSTLALSSSLNNRINQITGSLNDFTSSINTFTSSVVLTSQTSSMSVLSSSFAFNAVTAAFALNASAGSSTTNDGAYKILVQSTPATTWTFNHQMGQRYPIFQVFDTDGKVIIPTEITTVNSDNATITFSVPTAGKAIASLGVGSGGLSQYFSTSTTWSLAHNLNVDYPLVNVWDTNRNIIIPDRIESIDTNNIKVYLSAPKAGYLNVAKGGHIISGSVNAGNVDFTSTNIVSSSAQIRNHGFAITGSNTFVAPQTINSNLTITGTASVGNATIKQCTVTGITTSSAICSLATGSYNGAFFDYVVKNGVNMRAGTIMSAWEGGSVVYNETSTNDLGNTNAVTMSVNISGGNARLFAQVSSGTWSVSTLTRAIGGMGTTGGGTNFLISTGYTAPDYCSGLFGTDLSVYGNDTDWLTITRFYTDSNMTTPFNGNNKYYGNSNGDYGTTLQIDSSGYVIGFYAC